jgi:hypothetical protein
LQVSNRCTLSVLRAAAGFVLAIVVPQVASATLTIRSVSPYSKVNEVIYYAVAGTTVDTGANFRAYDLTTTSNQDDLVYVDVISSKAFTGLTAGQDVVVTLVASDRPIPIFRAGEPGSVSDCTAGTTCQAQRSGLYYAAKYPVTTAGVGRTIRIGFHPKRVCEETGNISGVCSGSSLVTPSSGTPTLVPLKIYIGLEKSDGDEGTISDSEERANVSLNFQSVGPQTGSCPAVSQFYFPGDQEISFNPSAFTSTFTVTSGAAAVDTLVVLAKDGLPPEGIDASNQITARVSSSAPSTIEGFTNTTTGTDHKYRLTVQARDRSGALSNLSCSEAASGGVDYEVQASTIQGLLTKSQCFIATAAFRSARDPSVLLLREFRDSVLARSAAGRAFIRFYYHWSPAAAQVVLEQPALRIPVLIALAPVQLWAWLMLHSKWILALLAMVVVMFVPRSMRGLPLVLAVLILGISSGVPSRAAEEDSIIDQVRRESPAPGLEVGESYTEKEKKRLGPAEEQESLISTIRKDSGSAGDSGEGYTARRKQELPPEEASESAVEAVRAGHAEVRAKKAPRQGSAFGMTISVKQDRTVTANASAVYRGYSSLYGSGYVPDFQFFYETQPFHGEWLGSIGLFGQFGFGWQSAYGTFEHSISNPDGGTFNATSGTKFTFVTLPASVGAVYRFNLLRFARPYVKAGGTLMGYAENRSDDRGTLWGNSRGYVVGAGVAFPFDFLDSEASWSMYEAHGVRRNCLTVDYQRFETISGALDFSISGISLGLLFEL